MLIGYTDRRQLPNCSEDHIALLRNEGCAHIIEEQVSEGPIRGRPRLREAIDSLQPGDTLVLAEWNRVVRSVMEGIRIIIRVHSRGANLKALDPPWLDLTTSKGKAVVEFVGALASEEKRRMRHLTRERIASARSAGERLGRRPKLSEVQIRYVLELINNHSSDTEIASVMNVHRTTVGRIRRKSSMMPSK